MTKITEYIGLHFGIVCDVCKVTPITGVRHNCSVCPDYNLCSKCKHKNHHSQHVMKELTNIEDQKLLKSLMIDPPRQIKFDKDFKMFGKHGAMVPFSKRRVLLRLQALVRQDMSREIQDLLKGVIAEENGQYKVLTIDLDGILQTKFRIPIYIVQKHIQEKSKFDNSKAWLSLTALQLAIVTKSSNAIRTILKHMLSPTRNGGRERSEEEIMNSIISTLANKVELKLPDDTQYYKREHLYLHGMNSFHLAAKYHPEAIQIIHQMTKNGIWELIVRKNIPETNITLLQMPDGNVNYRKETTKIGENKYTQHKHHTDLDEMDGHSKERNNLFGEEETALINNISCKITEEKFARHDPFYVLKFQNESFKRCLIQLQILLGRRNCMNKTPLHIAVEGAELESSSAVE